MMDELNPERTLRPSLQLSKKEVENLRNDLFFELHVTEKCYLEQT